MSEYGLLTPPTGRGAKTGVLVLDAPVVPDVLPLEADDLGHKVPVFFKAPACGLRCLYCGPAGVCLIRAMSLSSSGCGMARCSMRSGW